MTKTITAVRDAIRDVVDFPKPGIVFKDITPVLQDPALFGAVIDALIERYGSTGIHSVMAVESRGFFFAAPLAHAIGAGLVPLRKPGKLPYETYSESYQLEYGSASLEMHTDAVARNERVLILDDLLATGGTAAASLRLAQRAGADVAELAFVVELGFLGGRKKLPEVPVHSMIVFE
jgi:adenine phosphoribosyltransferase